MWAIVHLSLLKVREHAFYILLLIGIGICVMADGADPVSGQVAKNTLFDYALSGEAVNVPPITIGSCIAMLISILLGVFYGSSEIPAEVNSGLISVLLSKPVGRFRYFLGKYIGTALMTVGIYVLIEIVLVAAHFAFGTGTTDYSMRQIARQFIPPLLLIPLIAQTIAVSTFAGAMGGMVVTTVYVIFSLVMSFMPITLVLFPDGMVPGLDTIMTLLHYLFPNYLFYFQESVNGWLLLSSLGVYSLSMTVIFLLLGLLRIREMDLSPSH